MRAGNLTSQRTDGFWLVRGKLLTPRGIVAGAVHVARGRIAGVARYAPRGAEAIDLRGAYLAPGFIDLHVWGEPGAVSREAVRSGTTAFLTAIGPESPTRLRERLASRPDRQTLNGAQCLGVHLEGPFLNPRRSGVLPRCAMRPPRARELRAIIRTGGVRLMTLSPELPGAIPAIRYCRRHRIIVSLGHSDADAMVTLRAIDAGASVVTHVFNGMRPFHHRAPSLLEVALTDPRLTTMVITDGVHVSAAALRVLVCLKGPGRIALVTDAVRPQRAAWTLRAHGGAYYAPDGMLAGSRLTMIHAVRNAVELGGASLRDAVRMASETPAHLLGLGRTRGTLAPGQRADLVAFDRTFRVRLTLVGGRIVFTTN